MWEQLTRLFDWSVASVDVPMPFYNVQFPQRIAAYKVIVKYNYHDAKEVVFPVGDYGMFNCSRADAQMLAQKYYDKMCARIRQVKEK